MQLVEREVHGTKLELIATEHVCDRPFEHVNAGSVEQLEKPERSARSRALRGAPSGDGRIEIGGQRARAGVLSG